MHKPGVTQSPPFMQRGAHRANLERVNENKLLGNLLKMTIRLCIIIERSQQNNLLVTITSVLQYNIRCVLVNYAY